MDVKSVLPISIRVERSTVGTCLISLRDVNLKKPGQVGYVYDGC